MCRRPRETQTDLQLPPICAGDARPGRAVCRSPRQPRRQAREGESGEGVADGGELGPGFSEFRLGIGSADDAAPGEQSQGAGPHLSAAQGYAEFTVTAAVEPADWAGQPVLNAYGAVAAGGQ